MKLLIFDIDGTLTHLDGATRRAFDAAYVRLWGVRAAVAGLKLHGRTDPIIFRDCYFASGLRGDWETEYERFRAVYLEELPGMIASAQRAHLHAGVSELLAALEARSRDVALALGTGNMEGGARIKIGNFNLNRFFPVGGFGDMHHERTGILRDAIRNAELHWRARFDPRDTWVIGDTIHDIEGGKAVGLRTMGVATGGMFSASDLTSSGADVVFEDLSDTAAVLTAIGLD